MGIQERPSGQRGLVGGLWRTALLPGWGQRYLGAPGRGLIFMGAEAATWGTYRTFKVQEKLRRDKSVRREGFLPGFDEPRLSGRGRRLLFLYAKPPGKAESLPADGDRPGGDDDNVRAARF